MLAPPDHPLASRRRVTIEEVGREDGHRAQRSVARARARAPRCTNGVTRRSTFRSRCPASMASSGRWRWDWESRVLPRRCALAEIASGRLAAVKVPELASPRQIRLVFRRGAELSHAAQAFLETASETSLTVSEPRAVRERVAAVRSTSSKRSEQQRRRVPRARQERFARRRRKRRRDVRTRRSATSIRSRSTVDLCLRRALDDRSGSRRRDRPPPQGTACRARPSCRRRSPRTIRPITALNPRRKIACGACSRDDPQPKLRFTSRIVAPAISRVRQSRASVPPVSLTDVVLEEVLLQTVERDGLSGIARE